ncbi:MAG: bifunctional adenosylcobinamide kinase/adenosylcobinamide-phosphate guanylyltransferase [Lachnospiraceae bacterium]|nr:bifunctional adenosylcobinamide kinase/adenosylcobinamide-phosphate guanylyltransferase [Lachnospiraceae bacterium]
MELYIGGFAQGKLEYVLSKHPKARIVDEHHYRELFEESPAGEAVIWNHFHLAVRDMIGRGEKPQEMQERVLALTENCPDLIFISDEIGNGIVPMEREERTVREETGRMLCKIAARADLVERIFCGLPMRLK